MRRLCLLFPQSLLRLLQFFPLIFSSTDTIPEATELTKAPRPRNFSVIHALRVVVNYVYGQTRSVHSRKTAQISDFSTLRLNFDTDFVRVFRVLNSKRLVRYGYTLRRERKLFSFRVRNSSNLSPVSLNLKRGNLIEDFESI